MYGGVIGKAGDRLPMSIFRPGESVLNRPRLDPASMGSKAKNWNVFNLLKVKQFNYARKLQADF